MSSAIVTITGYLAADPQVNQAGNSSVTRLRIATNKRRGQEEITSWWSVSVWGKTGENCAKFLQKGRLVSVSGEVFQRTYTDKDGNERVVSEVDASHVDFGFGKSESRSERSEKESWGSRGDSGQGGGWGGKQGGGKQGGGWDDDPVPF